MVHKKSEYRLQFCKLSEDLRKHIWEENVKFRESCRLANQATHYWSYQLTDEHCECEDDEFSCRPANGSDVSQQSAQVELAIPAKSNIATNKNVGAVDGKQAVALPSSSNGSKKLSTSQSFPLQHSTEGYRREKYQAESVVPYSSDNRKILTRKENGSIDVFQVKNLTDSGTKTSGVTVKDAHFISETNTIRNATEVAVQTPDWKIPCCRLQDDKGKDFKNGKSSRRSNDLATCNYSSQLSQPVLLKTSRDHRSKEHKAPFAMFGWNSSGSTLADKKTHNVCAPEKEVHPEALLLLKKRREQVEKFLAEKRRKKQQISSTSLTHQAGFNHSSIWMSEYKDKFCHHDFQFEQSLFPCRKPPAARS